MATLDRLAQTPQSRTQVGVGHLVFEAARLPSQ